LHSYYQRCPVRFPEWNEERIPDHLDVVKRLTAVLFYLGQQFLHNFDVSTLNQLSSSYCQRVDIDEQTAWQCTWRIYDERSFLAPSWRETHLREAAEKEKELIESLLSRYGSDVSSQKGIQ